MGVNELTSANDVVITIGGQNMTTAKLVVDDFELNENDEKELHSGVGNDTPVAMTRGNVTYDFSCTLLGEDASIWQSIANKKVDDDDVSDELGLVVKTNQRKFNFSKAYVNGWSVSASDGDPLEISIDILCWNPKITDPSGN